MSLKNCLMILNARDIPECIKPLQRLNIDKVWFRGMTEKQLQPFIEDFIKNSDYENYIIVSDDVIVSQFALDNIIRFQEEYHIVTGWCNISPITYRATVKLEPLEKKTLHDKSLTLTPRYVPLVKVVMRFNQEFPQLYNHIANKSFLSVDEIWQRPEIFRTFFLPWALTSLPRDIWLKYGFKFPTSINASRGSDMLMSLRLYQDNISMWCARDSFMYHLATSRNKIVGKITPVVIIEKANEVIGYKSIEPNITRDWKK